MKWLTHILSTCLCLSIFLNMLLAARVLDRSMALDSSSSEVARRAGQVRVISALQQELLTNVTRERLLAAARAANLEVMDKGKDELYVGQIEFTFGQDGHAVALNFY